MLNTREVSVMVWSLVILIFVARSKKVRETFFLLIKAATTGILLKTFVLMAVYIMLLIIPIVLSNLWFSVLTKELILWTCGVAVVTVIRANEARGLRFFRNMIFDSMKLVVFIEYIIQLNTYHIIIELVLTPLLVLVAGMNAVSSYKEEFAPIKKFTDILLVLVGLSYLVYSLNQLISNFSEFATYENLATLTFPIILTFLFIPFTYMLAILIKYDSLVGKHGRLRLTLDRNSNKYSKYICRRIITKCNISISRWEKFNSKLANKLYNPSTKAEIDKVFKELSLS